MHFFDLIKKRRSIRSFKKLGVEDEKLDQLISAANNAPSAGNLQAYKMVAVTNEQLKEDLVETAFGQKFIADAPVVFVFLQDVKRSRDRYGDRGDFYSFQDAIIANTYLQLAAVELNLGTCWVGAFDEERVKELLNTDKRPVIITPVGYPAKGAGHETGRREADDMVEFLD